MKPSTDGRLRRAQQAAVDAGIDAFLIGPSADLTYLTGFSPLPLERLVLAVVRADGASHLIVPELEAPGARGSGLPDRMEIVGWTDDADPYSKVSALLPNRSTLAVGDTLWASHVLGLQAVLSGSRMVSAAATLGGLRSVKDDAELASMQAAAHAADRAFGRIAQHALTGRTEKEIAAELSRGLVEEGHDRADFAIVGGGPNSASPHHQPTSRRLVAGDPVVMDFGGEVDGYFSDITRTAVVGEEPSGFDEVYETVAAAQQAAFDAIAPGVEAQEVDRAARRVIEEAGFGENFIHRTGHGIGLEIHEPPYIVEGNETPLVPGMTFSLEPGIYLPGRFGVRIEDIVVVTETGAKRLNEADRALKVVG